MRNQAFVSYVREQFPALKNEFNGFQLAYLNGPGGYQVPMRVIRTMENYLIHACANSEGSYRTSILNDEVDPTCRCNHQQGLFLKNAFRGFGGQE